jgi:hypothetical protein
MPDTTTRHDRIAEAFEHFARHRTGRYAPLYSHLAAQVAKDEALLAIAAHAPAGQSVTDLMLAAVHYLLAEAPGHELAAFYPTLNIDPAPPQAAFPAFRRFALAREKELAEIISTRTVQTNEPRRCTYLLPALHQAAHLAGRELALVEAGSSAGLNLLIDEYGYRYGQTRIGNVNSPLVLECELRGPMPAPLTLPAPRIAWRAGLDLHPLDPGDLRDARWLEALVWADHPERVTRLRQALHAAAERPRPHTYDGDAAETLATAANDAPPDAALCLMHTAFLAHLTPHHRQRFRETVLAVSRTRPVYWIQAEPDTEPGEPRLRLAVVVAGNIEAAWPLADYHPHGAWITWKAQTCAVS